MTPLHSQTDPRIDARDRQYQAAQSSLSLPPRQRSEPYTPRLEGTVMALLPVRSDEWMNLTRSIPPEGVEIWVPLTWPSRILEFVSIPKHWACLWDCGSIETFAPDDRRKRAIFMTPHAALAVHRKQPLVDLSLHEKTLVFRFKRPTETPGTINAAPALHQACGLPQPARHTGAAA
ncbi:hypothetical protein [Asaia astilbis]|uniref:hypothetical protein n=1 Tax=Asaia astilbis TaxID=610244 RepID=UPI00047093C5|nr:hypothetical protein [Asaia astilbis]